MQWRIHLLGQNLGRFLGRVFNILIGRFSRFNRQGDNGALSDPFCSHLESRVEDKTHFFFL